MKHKNILLSFGTLATVVASISTIIACGDNESITEKSLKNERDKLQDFISSYDIVNSKIGDSPDDVAIIDFVDTERDIVQEYKSITGVEENGKGLSSPLTDGIEISKVILKTAYDSSTHKIVFTVTLGKSDDIVINNVKDITITFAEDLKLEKAKLKDRFISQVDVTDLGNANANYNFTTTTIDDEINLATQYKLITEWNQVDTSTGDDVDESKGLTEALASETEISKVVLKTKYDVNTHKIIFIVTLAKGGNRVTNNVKDITITFAEDLELEKAKLKDHFISQVDIENLSDNDVNADFTVAIVDDKDWATQYKLITEWNEADTSTGDMDESKGLTEALTGGITISKVVLKKVYDSSTHKVVFTVTLGQSDKVRFINNVKDVTVTLNKLIDEIEQEEQEDPENEVGS